jgi:hypothetical protein
MSIIEPEGIFMHSSSPCPSRCNTALGSLLAIGFIVIVSDITLAAGIARDVIAALGQHLVILSTIKGTRSARMLDQERPRYQDPRSVGVRGRRGDFPALKDNTAIRSGASGRLIIY